jgi:hypothetical protein
VLFRSIKMLQEYLHLQDVADEDLVDHLLPDSLLIMSELGQSRGLRASGGYVCAISDVKADITREDSRTGRVMSDWPRSTGAEPGGLALALLGFGFKAAGWPCGS